MECRGTFAAVFAPPVAFVERLRWASRVNIAQLDRLILEDSDGESDSSSDGDGGDGGSRPSSGVGARAGDTDSDSWGDPGDDDSDSDPQTEEWKMIVSATPPPEQLPLGRVPLARAGDCDAPEAKEAAEAIAALARRQATENLKHHYVKVR